MRSTGPTNARQPRMTGAKSISFFHKQNRRICPMRKLLLVVCCLVYSLAAAQTPGQLMYVGTLDKKLLIIDEGKEAVVGEVPLGGIPRTVALSADKKKLYIVSALMLLETVDLDAQKVSSSFSL